jgi:hypothetical protein
MEETHYYLIVHAMETICFWEGRLSNFAVNEVWKETNDY